MNATLGALMIMLCEVAVNEPAGTSGRGSSESWDEIMKVITEIREISETEKHVDNPVSPEPPKPARSDTGTAAKAFMDGGGYSISVDNFKEHAAALNLQRRFRENKLIRSRRIGGVTPRQAAEDGKGNKDGPVSPSSAKTGGGSEGEKPAPADVSLPGQTAEDGEPARAG